MKNSRGYIHGNVVNSNQKDPDFLAIERAKTERNEIFNATFEMLKTKSWNKP